MQTEYENRNPIPSSVHEKISERMSKFGIIRDFHYLVSLARKSIADQHKKWTVTPLLSNEPGPFETCTRPAHKVTKENYSRITLIIL